MASTLSNPSATFDFRGLPPELQTKVLLIFFEEPCTVSFSEGASAQPHSASHRFSRGAAMALVDKYFLHETIEATKASPHTIVELSDRLLLRDDGNIDDIDTIKAFTRNTSTIEIHHSAPYSPSTQLDCHGLPPARKLAPNLATLRISGSTFGRPHCRAVMRIAYQKDVLSIVQGHEDDCIATQAWISIVRDSVTSIVSWCFEGSAAIELSVSIALRYFEEFQQRGRDSIVLTIRVTPTRGTITRRQFKMSDRIPRSCVLVEATEENLLVMFRRAENNM